MVFLVRFTPTSEDQSYQSIFSIEILKTNSDSLLVSSLGCVGNFYLFFILRLFNVLKKTKIIIDRRKQIRNEKSTSYET